jgi:hypothetical protein
MVYTLKQGRGTMRNRIRWGVAGVAAASSLVFAGSALAAAFTPQLTAVSPLGPQVGPLVTISGTIGRNDDPIAKVQIYAPVGFNLSTTAATKKIGTATGVSIATDVGNDEEHLRGDIVAVNPSDQTYAQLSTTCDNVAHAAVWVARLQAAGQNLNVPIFVDKTTGTEAQFASYKLVTCLAPQDAPVGSTVKTPGGEKLVGFSFNLSAFTNPGAAGEYRWRSLWTPYASGTAAIDNAKTVEAQSVVRLPGSLSLTANRAKQGKRTVVTLRGHVSVPPTKLAAGADVGPGTAVNLLLGRSSTKLSALKGVLTTGAGDFVRTVTITKPTYFRAVVVTQPAKTDCTASFGAAVPCVSATVGGLDLRSGLIRVKP